MRITDKMITSCFPLGQNTVEYTLLLPEGGSPASCRGLVLWLHGRQERAAQILTHPLLEQLAEHHGFAVAIPDVPDTYYLNQSWNRAMTKTFLTSEFLPALQAKYSLPASPSGTAVVGISMGGFGSLLLGSRHPELFGKIASISGAFILNDVIIGNEEITGKGPKALSHFQNLFGDIPTLEDDPERNPEKAALQALADDRLPPVFLSCGTGDVLLYNRNRKLYTSLTAAGADVTWKEAAGSHQWECYEKILPELFVWLAG